MRRFHLPLIVGTVVWGVLAAMILFLRSPYRPGSQELNWFLVVVLLGLVGLSVTCGLSLLLYLAKRLFFGVRNERQATRVAIRQGFWVGLGVFLLGLLRVAEVLNIFTLGLTLVILIFLELTFRG